GREQVLRQERVETAVIDLADERPHGADHSTIARRAQRKIDPAAGPDATAPALRGGPRGGRAAELLEATVAGGLPLLLGPVVGPFQGLRGGEQVLLVERGGALPLIVPVLVGP